MIQKLSKVMIGPNSSSQPSQQLVWMVEVVVFSIGSGQNLDQLVLDVELHHNAAVVRDQT